MRYVHPTIMNGNSTITGNYSKNTSDEHPPCFSWLRMAFFMAWPPTVAIVQQAVHLRRSGCQHAGTRQAAATAAIENLKRKELATRGIFQGIFQMLSRNLLDVKAKHLEEETHIRRISQFLSPIDIPMDIQPAGCEIWRLVTSGLPCIFEKICMPENMPSMHPKTLKVTLNKLKQRQRH